MNSTRFVTEMALPNAGQPLEVRSLYQVLQEVADHRGKRGRRYQAAVVLTIIVLAKMTGEKAISGIAEWARLRSGWLQTCLPLKRAQLPCANTYQYVCDHIELDELNEKLGAFWVQRGAVLPEAGEGEVCLPPVKRGEHHLALDGKSLRGTARATPRREAVQLLGLYHVSRQCVLNQTTVPGPGQEHQTARELIGDVPLQGYVVSADALHTQPDWCRQVLALGGDYLLIAKRNQPTLRDDIALLFDHPPVPWLPEAEAQSVNKGHGRIEVRHLRTSSELGDYLAPRWPTVGQVFRIERRITRRHQTTTEVSHGLTSLPIEVTPAPRLLGLARDHWHIENRLHWRRDVTLGEDACRVRTGQTPAVLAALNNTVIALMGYLGVRNMAAQTRVFAANNAAALALLMDPL